MKFYEPVYKCKGCGVILRGSQFRDREKALDELMSDPNKFTLHEHENGSIYLTDPLGCVAVNGDDKP